MGIIGVISLLAVVYFLLLRRSDLLAFYARIQFQKGYFDKALRLFHIANRIGKMKPETMRYYGYMLLRSGELNLAEEVLTRASVSAKKPAEKKRIKAMLSLVVWKKGDLDLAIEMMEEAIEGFKVSNFYQNLGLMYVLKGERQKSLKFNLEAHDYNPDDMVIADNLAQSYVLCGEYEKGKAVYEELLGKEPHFPEPYYGYGLLLIKCGDRERGIEFIKKSLDKTFTFLSVMQKDDVEKILAEQLQK